MPYSDTLVAVADDCPVTSSAIPTARSGKKTVAVLQYEMLAEEPHVFTQEDVLFESWLARQDIADDRGERDRPRLRAEVLREASAVLAVVAASEEVRLGLYAADADSQCDASARAARTPPARRSDARRRRCPAAGREHAQPAAEPTRPAPGSRRRGRARARRGGDHASPLRPLRRDCCAAATG